MLQESTDDCILRNLEVMNQQAASNTTSLVPYPECDRK